MDTPDLPPTSACVDPGSASSSGLRTTEGPEITVGVHGGEAAALVPAGIKEYVRLLGGCKLRCWIMLMWLILTLSGLSVYFPLTLVLDIAIEPPFGSCVGVLIDCFVTTKITIPTLMALVPGNANFWPRAQREEPSSSGARAAQSPPRQTLRKSLSWTAPRSVRSVRSDPNSPSNGGSGTSKREREVGGSS